MYLRRCNEDPSVARKTLAAVTRAARLRTDLLNQAEVYLRRIEHDDCVIDEAAESEDEVSTFLRSQWTMVASDGGVGAHPKSYGTRARVLGRYVRERGLLSLEDAVRRMTSFPAQRLRLWDRGTLRPGGMADAVVFDPDRIIDRATRAQPTAFAEGVRWTIINGRIVIRDGALTAERPGRVLRGPAWNPPVR